MLIPAEFDFAFLSTDHPSLHSGGAGLFTTPNEYMKLLVPLINQGVGSTGARILKPGTVELMYDLFT